ncbi:MAG: hypothetical protein ACK5QW_05855 [Cyanobacteriota bacterium]|jgi:hypothetical protein
MTITLEGIIERKGFGPGTWALLTQTGETYELHQPPPEIRKVGLHVKVQGQIRDDVMSVAMVGPVLEVQHVEYE